MRVNIFIRKENEAEWEDIGNKSLWVNQRLREKAETRNYFTTPMPDKDTFKQEYHRTPQREPEIDRFGKLEDIARKTCKHGADPQFCKFLKPGKPCK